MHDYPLVSCLRFDVNWSGKNTFAEIYCGTIFGKLVQTDVDMIHAQLSRTKKMAFHENYHVLMKHSQERKIGPVLHQEYWL